MGKECKLVLANYCSKLIERYQAKAKECVFLHCQLQEASERALAVETNAKGLRMELNALHLVSLEKYRCYSMLCCGIWLTSHIPQQSKE